jgi:hypothetical protein
MKDGTDGADSVKQIRGVDTNPKGREPRHPGRAEVAGGHTQVIQESKYPDGQVRHGTNLANVHTDAKDQHYGHKDQEAHRRALGSQPHSDSKR